MALPDLPPTPAVATVIGVGAGLTGIAAACEIPAKLAAAFAGHDVAPRVLLIDHNAEVGSDMGESARAAAAADPLVCHRAHSRAGRRRVHRGDRDAILAAAAPVVQTRPEQGH